MKLAPKKCRFCLDQESYVTNGGLKPDEANIAAIKELDGPEARRRFLGMTNYLYSYKLSTP